MDKDAFVANDPGVQRAKAKMDVLQLSDNSRWGESRRFAGRSAGIRIERLEKARAQWSKAYDRAEARFNKLNLTQACA